MNLIWVAPVAILLGLYGIGKIRRGPGPSAATTGGAPASPLGAPRNNAITEAAFNQQPSEMGDAFGPDENTDGDEVISHL